MPWSLGFILGGIRSMPARYLTSRWSYKNLLVISNISSHPGPSLSPRVPNLRPFCPSVLSPPEPLLCISLCFWYVPLTDSNDLCRSNGIGSRNLKTFYVVFLGYNCYYFGSYLWSLLLSIIYFGSLYWYLKKTFYIHYEFGSNVYLDSFQDLRPWILHTWRNGVESVGDAVGRYMEVRFWFCIDP